MGVTSCLEICSKNENELINHMNEIKKAEEPKNKDENNIMNNSDNNINNINEEEIKIDYKFQAFKNKFEKSFQNLENI